MRFIHLPPGYYFVFVPLSLLLSFLGDLWIRSCRLGTYRGYAKDYILIASKPPLKIENRS